MEQEKHLEGKKHIKQISDGIHSSCTTQGKDYE